MSNVVIYDAENKTQSTQKQLFNYAFRLIAEKVGELSNIHIPTVEEVDKLVEHINTYAATLTVLDYFADPEVDEFWVGVSSDISLDSLSRDNCHGLDVLMEGKLCHGVKITNDNVDKLYLDDNYVLKVVTKCHTSNVVSIPISNFKFFFDEQRRLIEPDITFDESKTDGVMLRRCLSSLLLYGVLARTLSSVETSSIVKMSIEALKEDGTPFTLLIDNVTTTMKLDSLGVDIGGLNIYYVNIIGLTLFLNTNGVESEVEYMIYL